VKKLFFLSLLVSTQFLACIKTPELEPEPELIRAYCYFYHFIPELGSVIWEANDIEVPFEKLYAELFLGAIILESESEEIAFAVKLPGTKEVLADQLIQLEQDKYYNIFAIGSKEETSLIIREIDTSQPQDGNVKLQVLHSMTGLNAIDMYMGGTTPDKRVVTELDSFLFTDHFEVWESDIRASIIVTKHSEEYNQDSVLLTWIFNGNIESGASYLSVVANATFDPESEINLWMYLLPLE